MCNDAMKRVQTHLVNISSVHSLYCVILGVTIQTETQSAGNIQESCSVTFLRHFSTEPVVALGRALILQMAHMHQLVTALKHLVMNLIQSHRLWRPSHTAVTVSSSLATNQHLPAHLTLNEGDVADDRCVCFCLPHVCLSHQAQRSDFLFFCERALHLWN